MVSAVFPCCDIICYPRVVLTLAVVFNMDLTMSGYGSPAQSPTKSGISKKASLSTIPAKFKKYYHSTSSSSILHPDAGSSSQSIHNKSHKLRPSELSKASVINPDDYPMIIDFAKVDEPGATMNSAVNPDTPLFQASPTVMIFQDYAPYAIHERKLYFRNNDNIARRLKIVQPDSPFFEVSAAKTPNLEPVKASKVAAGIEICYTVKFIPKDVRDYSWDLICATERETFIIPIRAIGLMPKVNFPDELDFGASTVGLEARKLLLLKNTGTAVAKFSMSPVDTNSVFTCPLEELSIEPNMSITIEVSFTPLAAAHYSSDFKIEFTKGKSCYISTAGLGQNVDVTISTSHLLMEPTYISLRSQKTLRIINRSDIPISFKWKSFSNLAFEENERMRLMHELDKMEAIEMLPYQQQGNDGNNTSNLHVQEDIDADSFEYSADNMIDLEDEEEMTFEHVASQAQLVRKYRHLRRALQKDSMLFVDTIFDVSPGEGQVWADSEIEITVSFHPDTACLFEAMAYLEVAGREDRLVLNLNGNGIGAYATLSFDVLDIGDVFINTEYFYEVTLRNKGDIPADWSYVPSNSMASRKVNLVPREGTLDVGQSKVISIRFECDILGDILESLQFLLQGTEDPISCKIKGTVVGPTFHFDCLKIDYGIVSYDYLHSTSIRIVNSSNISMIFSLSIPQDSTSDQKKEFDINPPEGTLGPGEYLDINVDFIPGSAKIYEYTLDVDVLGVGESLMKIPIYAECVIGGIRLQQKELVFGESFIRYPYERFLTLTNTSPLVHTKYEILPQLQYTSSIALYEPEQSVGFIGPGQTIDVKIQLIAQRIGSFRIALAIAVLGSKDAPLQIGLTCSSVGPKLVIDKSEVRWGNIHCLTDSVRSIAVKNESPIVAPIKTFVRLARSKFRLSSIERTLEPMETFQLDITCNLDDSIPHKDELYIVVEEGEHLMVPLVANGIGSTMFCLDNLEAIDLGTRLTNSHFEKKFILENRGRRPQQLHWYNRSIKELNANRLNALKKKSKDSSLVRAFKPAESKFTIEPMDITLRPHTATTFTIKGYSATAGSMHETLVLESLIGKERAAKEIIVAEVHCEVVDPLVEFSESEMHFQYNWQKGFETKSISKTLTITNKSALNLNFVLKADSPFNLNSYEHLLNPGQNVEIVVDFYPFYRDDRLSHIVNNVLTVAYRGHPQRDTVALIADIQFPNLAFDKKSIEFGCVLNDTVKFVVVKMTNTSHLDATYEWSLLEPAPSKMNKVAKGRTFDILPFRSILRAGVTEEVKFSMLGAPDQKLGATAICTVEGGPEYKIALTGEASAVAFGVDVSYIDFGNVIFNESAEKELVIRNTGKVAFPFSFDYSLLSSVNFIEASPATGTISPGEQCKVILRVYPVVPAALEENISIKIAHFDAVTIKCFCTSIFPCVYLTLPRYKKIGPYGEVDEALVIQSKWEVFIEEATTNITRDRLSMSKSSVFDETLLSPLKASTAEIPRLAATTGEDDLLPSGFSPKKTLAETTPKALALDVEMQRLLFCNSLQKSIEDSKQIGGASPPDVKNLQAFVAANVDLKKVNNATYLLDFGNVICGQSKKKIFKITNASATGPLSWSFDHRTLASSGFTIDPEKVAKVPELATLDLVVKFSAKKTLGRKEVFLPLELHNGPSVTVVLVATVCLPDIEMSTENVFFDRLLVGMSQKMYVRLTNISHVTANWSFKKTGKDEARFTIDPMEGSLLGRRSCIVSIEFLPTENKKCSIDAVLRIDTNSKQQVLKLNGEGSCASVQLSPLNVELGPILPFAKGCEQAIQIQNTGDSAFEIFSLDFDTHYPQEEERLLAFDGFDLDGVFRWDVSKDQKFSLDALLALSSCNNNGSDSIPPPSSIETQLSAHSADLPELLHRAPLRSVEAPRDAGTHQDYLLLGPSLIGVTTLARQLALHLRLPMRSIDDILQEFSKVEGDLGLTARRILGTTSEQEQLVLRLKDEQLSKESEDSKKAATDAYKKSAKGKGKDKEVPVDVLRTPQVLAYESFLKSSQLFDEVVASLVQSRLTWDDAGYGIVFDGVSSKFCDAAGVLRGLKKALPGLATVIVDLAGGEEAFATRISSLQRLKTLEEEAIRKAYDRTIALGSKPPVSKGSKRKSVSRRASSDDADSDAIPRRETVPLHLVPTLTPCGDEPWVDVSSGLIVEQEVSDYRSLDPESRTVYLAQYKSQLKTQMFEVEDVLKRLSEVWSSEKQCVLLAPAKRDSDEATTENASASVSPSLVTPGVLYFGPFTREVVPLAYELFSPPPLPVPAVTDSRASLSKTAGSKSAPIETVSVSIPSAVVAFTSGVGDDATTAFNELLPQLPLPAVLAPDPNEIPPTQTFQLIRKPYPRQNHKFLSSFEIVDINDTEADQPLDLTSPPKVKPRSATGTKREPAPSTAAEVVAERKKGPSRWTVQPNECASFKVRFKCDKVGVYNEQLHFEIANTMQEFTIPCTGICDVPRVNDDPRNVFMKRIKSLPPSNPHPSRRFVLTENFYSFGPLLIYKKAENSQDPALSRFYEANCEMIRLTNTGRYAAKVDLSIECLEESMKGVFVCETPAVHLEEGESKDVKIWAFPSMSQACTGNLVATIQNNPQPIRFELRCLGVVPSAEVEGPWVESIRQADANVAACKDKKVLKELEQQLAALKETFTIDFDRILVNKADTRSFSLRNTSTLPIAWEIDRTGLRDSTLFSLTQTSGHLDVGATLNIDITFQSPEAAMASGKFTLKYADIEAGLLAPSRIKTMPFRLTAEAYHIKTVNFDSDGQELKGNEVDFGSMRVGDIAVQTVKIANKGKYKIAFQLSFKKKSLANLLKIEPESGVIDSGNNSVEFKLTFCCPDGEMTMKASKDLRVRISEPLSGQIVEEFPLLISAQTSYNRFRMQPMRGISFGAVRYDAEVKSRRVEITNDGAFEFSYVVCAAADGGDEIVKFDPKTLLCYAYNTPAGLRKSILVDDYLEVLNSSPAAGKGTKKDAKAAAKKEGKGTGGAKSCVVDPDQLVLEAIPDDPLKLAAFTISSRMGVIQPGQTAGFDVSFDPSNTAAFKAKLRVCLTGVDANDTTVQSLRTFDLSGESCFPAIVVDDVASIFEEIEVVPSLSAAIIDRNDQHNNGPVNIDRLPVGKVVYAEVEKTLVFGPVVSGQAGSKGMMERIRITNPTRIDTKVKFRIDTGGAVVQETAKKAGAKETKKGAQVPAPVPVVEVFSIQPAMCDIPPREHRFVNIYFSPTESKSYKATFIAEIDSDSTVSAPAKGAKQQGVDAVKKGEDLTFHLAGTGTLPSIVIESPTARNTDGSIAIDFPRIHAGKRRQKNFVIRNTGVLPVTCLFEMSGDVAAFNFPSRGASATLEPGSVKDIPISFTPKSVDAIGNFEAQIKIIVLNNQLDQSVLKLKGSSYTCDAMIEMGLDGSDNQILTRDKDVLSFQDINLAEGPGSVNETVYLRSISNYTLKYEFKVTGVLDSVLAVSPSVGHLSPRSLQEIQLTFASPSPINLDGASVTCTLSRIAYKDNNEDSKAPAAVTYWNNAMKLMRPATEEDIKRINAYNIALKEFQEKNAKTPPGKKKKSIATPPEPLNIQLAAASDSGDDTLQMVYEITSEPKFDALPSDTSAELSFSCQGVADYAKYTCEIKDTNIPFLPTFMFQSAVHTFTFKNDCNLSLPLKWSFEDIRSRRKNNNRLGTAQVMSRGASRGLTANSGAAAFALSTPNPFSIEPAEVVVPAHGSQEFSIKFLPLETDEFIYALRAETFAVAETVAERPTVAAAIEEGSVDSTSQYSGLRAVVRGTAKRPVCHFEMKESPDYLSRRPANSKNEYGLQAPIEADVKVAELESIGLRSRNSYRFHILNPTSENYEFSWEAVGDPSPYWRCVYASGMLFSGKRVEMVFEYLPEETPLAETFFKFKLPNAHLEQMFLFTGKVIEPNVNFSQPKVNFQNVMLAGEGSVETIYLENPESIPFHFAFDKATLLHLEGPTGPVLTVSPLSGVIPPQGRLPIQLNFKPQEELQYNFNLLCGVKRKPRMLSLNLKGEGYAVHATIQMEQGQKVVSTTSPSPTEGALLPELRVSPFLNTLDFGTVKVRESVSRKFVVTNAGKFNFNYAWNADLLAHSSVLSVSGGKLGGTLKKGQEITYDITFSPQKEEEMSNISLSFVVAGKYTYRIVPRGAGVLPALRFSFMNFDMGPCFVTSPGGTVVVEQTILKLINQEPSANISVECLHQKTQALWVECPSSAVIGAGSTLEVPIMFAPRDVKEYMFIIPFLINGSTKVSVTIVGRGIPARVELVNPGQHRINFGVSSVGSEVVKSVPIINRTSKAVTVQLADDGNLEGMLACKCLSVSHMSEFTLAPRSTTSIVVTFTPTRRIPLFSEDLSIRYAGITRKLVTVTGRAEGETNFDE